MRLLVWSLPALALAHDPGLSTAEIHVLPQRITVTVALAPNDIAPLVSNGGSSAALAPRLDACWHEIASSWFDVRSDAALVRPNAMYLLANSSDTVRFRLEYAVRSPSIVDVTSLRLSELPAGHRQFAIVVTTDGEVLAKAFLTSDAPHIEFAPEHRDGPHTALQSSPRSGAFVPFLQLGVQHIWTGYDHLLFLFALLVVCRTFGSIAAIISCFTVAHSLTLAAATLNLVNLPSRVVEPAIAVSIVFVAIENLVGGGTRVRRRAVLTFCFGLIHGLGFASVLRDLGVAATGVGVARPLIAFNAGVELGQMAIAVVALPLVWQLRKHKLFVAHCVPAVSACVGLAGVYWFLARTVLP